MPEQVKRILVISYSNGDKLEIPLSEELYQQHCNTSAVVEEIQLETREGPQGTYATERTTFLKGVEATFYRD